MLRYSQSHLCRTRLLVTYFGYLDAPPCGTCDNCLRAAKRRAAAATRRRDRTPNELAARRGGDPATRKALLEEAMRRRHAAGRGRALKIERVKRPVFGPLEKGDIVRHAMWGEGEVVRVVGDSDLHVLPGARREAAQGAASSRRSAPEPQRAVADRDQRRCGRADEDRELRGLEQRPVVEGELRDEQRHREADAADDADERNARHARDA